MPLLQYLGKTWNLVQSFRTPNHLEEFQINLREGVDISACFNRSNPRCSIILKDNTNKVNCMTNITGTLKSFCPPASEMRSHVFLGTNWETLFSILFCFGFFLHTQYFKGHWFFQVLGKMGGWRIFTPSSYLMNFKGRLRYINWSAPTQSRRANIALAFGFRLVTYILGELHYFSLEWKGNLFFF